MGRHFLQLRDQGCQGAWEIFFRARDVMQKSAAPFPEAGRGGTVALAVASGSEARAELWKESAALAGCTLTGDRDAADMIIGVGLPRAELLALSPDDKGAVLVDGGSDEADAARVLADLLVLVRHFGHDADKLDKICVSWMGSASGRYAGLANSWLESCLCFRHAMFFSFPPGGEPHHDELDFAMNAGGKIFLSHEPSLVADGAHGMVAVPWLESGAALAPRHPLLADEALRASVRSELGEACIFSFVPALTSPLDEDRRACLIACQSALLEHMAVLSKHTAA